jgi:hypothetical protein
MKYKACCFSVCGLGNCKTREDGGCYCVCRLNDYISLLQGAIEGTNINGCIYFPSKTDRDTYLNKMSEENRKIAMDFQEIKAPIFLEEAYEKLKKYQTCPS